MVNNLEGYAEYAVQKKLKAKDRMPVVASVLAAVVGFVIWMFVSGPVGPLVILAGIVCTVITVSRQEIEYEYIFVNGTNYDRTVLYFLSSSRKLCYNIFE